MHYYGSSLETDLQWLREEVTNKRNQRKTVEIQQTKLEKLRTDLFILNACIIQY